MEITLYSRTVCVQCKATKRKLEALGLPYVEINTEHDEEAAELLRSKGYLQAPVVIVSDGQEWTGYRPDLLEALAALAAE